MPDIKIILESRYLKKNKKVTTSLSPKKWPDLLDRARYHELQDCNHWCAFDIEYEDITICDVSPIEPPVQWHEPGRYHHDKILILLKPSIQPVNYPVSPTNRYCKCGITSEYECPKCIQDGKCTSPFIIKMLGEVLFPERYGKQR